ncbi:hypothetical protein [Neobacillus vireti]
MNISEKLTEHELLEILLTSYKKGQEKDHILVADLLEEMKQLVLSVINER